MEEGQVERGQVVDGGQIGAAQTLVSLFLQRVAASGGPAALHYRRHEAWESLTWDELARLVRRMAGNLARAGVRPGDRVAQVSENRYEWIVCDLAILTAGAVHVPIHASLAGAQIVDQLGHSGAELAIFSDAAQAEKLLPFTQRLPEKLRCFVYDPPNCQRDKRFVGDWTDLVAERGDEQPIPDVTDPELPATILYTSGTSGDPKGVTLTHGNLVFNAVATESMNRETEDDVRLSFLPLSHIFARTCDVYTWLVGQSTLVLAGPRETLLDDLATWRPTKLNGVPFFYDWVVRELRQRNQTSHVQTVRELLGGRVRACCSGGAALPDDLYDDYLAQGVPLLQGYGLTESSPVISISTPDQYRRGSVGRPLPGVEVSLAADGEILTRGPHVMHGYYRCSETTRDTVCDGWLHTGDIGHWDEDGFLYITGRKRDMIVTSTGINVAPARLESLLTADPLIQQACVVGEGRDFLAALIVPDREQLVARLKLKPSVVASEHAELDDPRVVQLYQRAVAERLAERSAHEQVRRFELLARDFSLENGELTSKRSLCRTVIAARHHELIESMFAR